MAGRNIAMWSAPRNLSTAMMRSFGNRADTTVIDEPLYAHYLANNTVAHPMRDAIIAQGETRPARIIEELTRAPASELCYQKHITTHWSDAFGRDWLTSLSHAFLIRAPAAVVASYDLKHKGGTSQDLGYEAQAQLFALITELTGATPVVIDATRFLQDPEEQLRTVCDRLNIPFDHQMLSWPAGPRETDGVWGAHWYDAVNRSTGFKQPAQAPISFAQLDSERKAIATACQPHYEALSGHAI